MTRHIAAAHQILYAALAFLGDFRELGRRLPLAIKQADEVGDRYASASLRLAINNSLWLANDDPATAAAQVQEGMSRWSSRGVDVQHYFALVAASQIQLYEGDPVAASEAIASSWRDIERAHILRIQFASIMLHALRGRAALAIAAEHGPDKSAHVSAALRDARALDREQLPYARAYADLLRAGGAAVGDDHDKAIELLRSAAGRFEQCGMAVHVAVTGRRIAKLRGQPEDEADLRRCGVENAARMTRMLAPGF